MRKTFILSAAGLLLALGVNASADKWDFRNESIYFVVTDRFADGDPGNNNIYGDEYQPGNMKYYQGGDFKGYTEVTPEFYQPVIDARKAQIGS